jgi:hypothetical protein
MTACDGSADCSLGPTGELHPARPPSLTRTRVHAVSRGRRGWVDGRGARKDRRERVLAPGPP